MRIFLLSFQLVFCFAISAQKIVVATYQYATNDRIANITPIANYLVSQLESEVEVRSYPTVGKFIEGIRNDEVDIALINTFGYFLLAEYESRMRPCLTLSLTDSAKDNYKTVFIASSDFPGQSLSDLTKFAPSSVLALVASGSTSGNLVPRLALSSIGLQNPERSFSKVYYSGTHRSTIDSVITGKASIGALGNNEYNNFRSSSLGHKIKPLWVSPEIPLGPVLIHDRITASVRARIIQAMLSVHEKNPHALESLKNGWSEAKQASRYISIDHSYYLPFMQMFGDPVSFRQIITQFSNGQ